MINVIRYLVLFCMGFCHVAIADQHAERMLLEYQGIERCSPRDCREGLFLEEKMYDAVMQGKTSGAVSMALKDPFYNLMERDLSWINVGVQKRIDDSQSVKLSMLLEKYGLLSAPYQKIDIKSNKRIDKNVGVFRVPAWSSLPLQHRIRGTLLRFRDRGLRNVLESSDIEVFSEPQFAFVDEDLDYRAVQTLKEYLSGKRSAGDTFLIDNTGKLLAATEKFGLSKVLSESNVFFLYWRAIDKLEIGLVPVVEFSNETENTIFNSPLKSNSFASQLLSDPLILRSYKNHLANLEDIGTEDIEASALKQSLRGSVNVEDDYTNEVAMDATSRSDMVKSLISKYSFLRKSDTQGYDFEIGPGRLEVKDTVRLPHGYSLFIHPGTTLVFGQDAGLILQGKLDILGSSTNPVVLKPIDGSWRGVAVVESSEKSNWQNVEIAKTQGLTAKSGKFDGGVSFILSDFNCTHCKFYGSKSTDVVNIVSSTYSIKNSIFVGAVGDLLDADFSYGDLRDVSFTDTDGDAIDIGGGELNASRVEIASAGDKAISAGEKAIIKINDSSIKNVAFGAAAKDGANVELLDVDIERVTVGLLAYRQSACLGYGVLHAKGVEIASSLLDTLRQQDSTLVFNEIQANAVPINVGIFYLLSKLELTYFKVATVLIGLALIILFILVQVVYSSFRQPRLTPSAKMEI